MNACDVPLKATKSWVDWHLLLFISKTKYLEGSFLVNCQYFCDEDIFIKWLWLWRMTWITPISLLSVLGDLWDVTSGNWKKVQSKTLFLSSLILTNPQNPLRQSTKILSWSHTVIQIFFKNNWWKYNKRTLTVKLEQLNKYPNYKELFSLLKNHT